MSPHPPELERRYRGLLFAYSPAYRAERGEEIVATLLDLAGPGRRTPNLAEAADLIAGGLRQRLGLASIAGFDAGLGVAAPFALTVAVGISAFACWRVEPITAVSPAGGTPLFGVFRTLGPIAYAAWLLAGAGRVLLRPAASRALIAVAIGVTLALPLLAPLTGVDRPPLWVLMALVVFGLVAFVGGATPVRTTEERMRVVAGAVAIAVGASAVTLAWPPPGGAWGYYYQPTISRVGVVVAITVGIVATIAVVRLARGRGAAPWLWAAVLLGLPAGWLGPFDPGRAWLIGDPDVPRYGRLVHVLLATCVAVIAIISLTQIRAPGAPTARRPDALTLATTGAGALGCAGGLAAYLLPAGVRPPVPVLVMLLVLTVTGLIAIGPTTVSRPLIRWPLLCVALAAAAYQGAVIVAVYDRDRHLDNVTFVGPADLSTAARTAALVSTIGLVPLALCAVTAAWVLSVRPYSVRPVLVLGLSGGWLGYLTLPYLLTWGSAVMFLVAGVAVLAARRSVVGMRQD